MKHKIYIAGKVTGENKLDCAAKFAQAKAEIEASGFDAINPLEVVGTWEIEWQPAMRKCIKALMDCDAVLILPCANNSRGAKVERELVEALAIPHFFTLEILKRSYE